MDLCYKTIINRSEFIRGDLAALLCGMLSGDWTSVFQLRLAGRINYVCNIYHTWWTMLCGRQIYELWKNFGVCVLCRCVVLCEVHK
jgi:hypothetical protein